MIKSVHKLKGKINEQLEKTTPKDAKKEEVRDQAIKYFM